MAGIVAGIKAPTAKPTPRPTKAAAPCDVTACATDSPSFMSWETPYPKFAIANAGATPLAILPYFVIFFVDSFSSLPVLLMHHLALRLGL